jgi:hypothetical protein
MTAPGHSLISKTAVCRLISRKQIQYKSFAGLATTMAGLKHGAIFEGEIVYLDNDGRSQTGLDRFWFSHQRAVMLSLGAEQG